MQTTQMNLSKPKPTQSTKFVQIESDQIGIWSQ